MHIVLRSRNFSLRVFNQQQQKKQQQQADTRQNAAERG